MDKIVRIFLLKLAQKSFLYNLECNFLNDMDIQLIIEFKNSLEIIITSFLKILKEFFLGHPL